jgi:hypothetical protein
VNNMDENAELLYYLYQNSQKNYLSRRALVSG